MKTFLISFLLMAMAVSGYAQKVKPVLNLAKGETYYNISILNSSISQTFNGQQVNYTISMSAKIAFKVVDIKDTVYNMEVAYKSIGMKIESPQMNMDFNSDGKDPQDLPSKILAAMRDKPFLVALSKTGRIISIQNIDNIMNSVFGSVATADSAQKTQLKTQFTQSFGEKAFKGNFEQTMAIYPNTKVSKNDTWAITTYLESTMSATITTNYQLVDITDADYIIHGTAKMITNKEKVTHVNGLDATYDLNGTIISDIKADKKTGWVTEAKLKEDISGNFDIQDNPQVPGGMQVPMSIHSDIITTDQ
jgi:hypothetical protein